MIRVNIMDLEKYFKKISKLRTDKNRTRWSEITNHQAPHKPFVLLSVMDRFAQEEITDNIVVPSPELVDTIFTGPALCLWVEEETWHILSDILCSGSL